MSSTERARANADLLLLIASAALLLFLPGSGPLSPVRSFLGLVLALLGPGYVVTAALFPGQQGIDGIERAALSLGLSIVSVVLIALGLNFLANGIAPTSLEVALAGFIAFFAMLAYALRQRTRVEEHSVPPSSGLSPLLVVLATGVVVVTALAVPTTRSVAHSTAFFVLGPKHLLSSYVHNLAPREGFALIVGVRNYEARPSAYRITGPLLNAPVSVPVLPVGGEWKKRISLHAPGITGRYKVSVELRRPGDLAPYRTLYVWVQVQGPSLDR